ncbi:biotin--protein ligase [Mycolicibacterium canariasense]|uniref:biotin--[biotin carboxyl-carrier protein] ligase n=1 Tax=Mycolicibacterium canariasense TaxID=228230 RepID=A0A100WI36_MYCCR|nr:biotin--[acetyl-CoA-carboxylase] ligase [Mycolicibacterium canariasense]MCV7208263.1 biotin--[acetyl-CoA-carboxylase] ligase [Mycolicibacterium canariasense]ORV09408.1 biotin--acetyl-CoA-carboxylase ligase [Mycolicibacterium canariasense]GAS98992.1 biotin--protein ligase [Mycolicibacterium canariasense]
MTAEPRALDAAALRAALDTEDTAARPWRRLDIVEVTGSTNADLIARSRDGDDIAGAVLLAEHQTAGRGRGGRSWAGVRHGQIIMSVGIATDGVDEQRWGLVPLLAGVAVVDTLSASGIDAGLKWPNDVLIGTAKIAGILAEVASPKPVIVLGIGLNVAVRPEEIGQPQATSVYQLGVEADRTDIVRTLLARLGERIGQWRTGDTDALLDDYRARSATLGARVRAQLPGGRDIVGMAEAIDGQGRLRIGTESGSEVVSAADIVHLRPAGDGAVE